MNDMQKIVVLCVLVCALIAVTGYLFGSAQVAQAPERMDDPTQQEDGTTDNPEPVACTMDAKMCPDGSFVGRSGPNCEFEACPASAEDPTSFSCTEDMKNALNCDDVYAPVCGLVQVQCITTPCDPVPETFSNACEACARGNVLSYSEGACALQ